jgi:hypothetical protein
MNTKIISLNNRNRNNKIFSLYKKGLSRAQISREVKLTGERVSQILFVFYKVPRRKVMELISCTICKKKIKPWMIYNGSTITKKGLCCKCATKLRKKKWSLRYDKCISCKETKRKHRGRGFCVRCYDRIMYNTNPNYKKRLTISSLKWYNKVKDDKDFKLKRKLYAHQYYDELRKIRQTIRRKGKARSN